jgi:AAA15 family ATPase/GTPase
VNVILGGGDVGKTTILEAIALLFSPVNPTMLSPIRLSRPRYRKPGSPSRLFCPCPPAPE